MVDKKEDKQIELEGVRKNLSNVEFELGIMESSRKEQEDRIVLAKRQIEVSKRLHEIAMTKFVPLDAAWEFMNDEEYNNLRRELSDIEFKFKLKQLEQGLRDAETRLQGFIEQYESLYESKGKLEDQIKELEPDE